MTGQQSDKNQKGKKSADDNTSQPVARPEQGSPMEKFNSAMRKILSVPKKNISKK